MLAKYEPETVRFFLLRTHYRTALNYSDAHLDDARNSLKRLYTALGSVTPAKVAIDWTQPHAARFKAAMDVRAMLRMCRDIGGDCTSRFIESWLPGFATQVARNRTPDECARSGLLAQ